MRSTHTHTHTHTHTLAGDGNEERARERERESAPSGVMAMAMMGPLVRRHAPLSIPPSTPPHHYLRSPSLLPCPASLPLPYAPPCSASLLSIPLPALCTSVRPRRSAAHSLDSPWLSAQIHAGSGGTKTDEGPLPQRRGPASASESLRPVEAVIFGGAHAPAEAGQNISRMSDHARQRVAESSGRTQVSRPRKTVTTQPTVIQAEI